eukprot:9489047-Pyramimonas_sp.AAC.1
MLRVVVNVPLAQPIGRLVDLLLEVGGPLRPDGLARPLLDNIAIVESAHGGTTRHPRRVRD